MADASSPDLGKWVLERASLLPRLRGGAHGTDGEWWKKSRRSEPSEPLGLRRGFERTGASGVVEAKVETRQRFERLADGAQPAVIKIVAFGGGGATQRVASYISRDGQIGLENEIGINLLGRQVAAETVKEWAPLYSGAEKSRDLALFQTDFSSEKSGPSPVETCLSALHQAFDGRSFAASIQQIDDQTQVKGIVVLNLPARGRLEIDRQAEVKIEARLQERLDGDLHPLSFQYGRHGHGVRFAGSELRKLVEKYPGNVYNEHGVMIETARQASQLAQRDWRSKLESRGPRDHMHLLISAPSQASKGSFEATVREFLSSEFGGHRYVFAIHDPVHDPKSEADGGKRPHLHAHALIATRSNYGDRLRVWVTDLNHYRETFSKCARDQGLAVEVTHRHETLQAPAYKYRDVRPVSFAGRTQHIGTSAAAQQRYDEKRSQMPYIDNSSWAKSKAQLSRKIWEEIANEASTAKAQAFAGHMLSRFDEVTRRAAVDQTRQASIAAMSDVTARAVNLRQTGQGRDMGDVAVMSASSERLTSGSKENRRAEMQAGTGQSNAQETGRVSDDDVAGSRVKAGLASALHNLVGAVRGRHAEPPQGSSETSREAQGLGNEARSEGTRGGGPLPGHVRESQQYEHIDLSQQPRHPAPDPAIEKTERSGLAGHERGRTEDRSPKQQDRNLDNGDSGRRREDDRIYDR